MTTFPIERADGARLAGYRWDPAGPPRAAVQIAHGVGEHARRYAPVAAALTAAGYVVYAWDHRGHGASAPSPQDYGQIGPEGWRQLVADYGLVPDRIAAEHPGLPTVLFGHSLGSFAGQQYLADHSDRYAAVAFTGTAALDLMEPGLDLSAPVGLEAFNAAFQPSRTDFDWLSRDEAQVDAYIADPACGFNLDLPAFRAVFAGARPLAEPDALAAIRPGFPLYVAVGEADPVNAGLALVTPLVQRYRDAGLDVTFVSYPGARHELLNETNRAEVESDLIRWLDRVLA